MDPVPSQSFGSPKDNGNTARVAQSDSDDKKEQDQVAVGSGDAQLNQSGVGATALFTLQGSETSNLVKEENSSGELGVVMNSKSSESISQELHQEVTPDTQQNHTTIASIIPSNHGKNIDSNNSMISSDVEVQVSNSQTGSDIMQANRAQFSPLNHSQNTVSSSSMAGVSSIKASTHQTTSLFSATPVSSLQPSVSLFSEVHALRSQPYISYQNVPMSYAPGTLSEAREVLPVPAIQSKCDHKVQDSVVALDSMQRREPKVINAEQAPSVASASGSSTAGVGSHSGGTPRVKDALGYLERVKEVFKGKLDVYSNFLDIMKQFKAQTINTEGVIARVKSIFQGHRDLILGFNQFLPPGYEIDIPEGSQEEFLESVEKPQSYAAGVYNIGDMNSSFSKGPLRKLHAPSVGSIPPALNSIEKQEAIGFESPKPTMEFNYAVNYVAKIKKTFENQPSIYERFLQILHQYQARRTSQEAIESVKAEVNRLFYGHPDLLDEFNYFLPESLPEGTSEGATMSPLYASQMGTMPGINSQSAYQYQMSLSQSKRSQGVPRAPQTQTAKVKKGQVRDRTKASSTQNLQSASPSQLQQLSSSAQKIPAIPPDSRKEMAVLEYIKGSLPRPVYIQFLRCLNLYAKKILDKSELVCLLEDLFAVFSVSVPKSQEILTRFKENVLEYSDWEESHSSHLERKNYYSFIASMAGQNCPRVTPSYLELPKNVARPYYSGRTTLCDSVLNESAVSVPKGSEGAEEESSKSFRRNQYEEAIFHVEDQRYEVERLIELCDFSIKNLTEIYDEIEPLGPDKGNLVPFEDKLDVLTIKTVSQIYSEQWYECLFSLKENAFRTIPLILSRLEQKKKEWGQLKKQLRRSWRNTLAENHHRSLDHRSFSFKLEERKRLTSRNLIAEFHDFKVKSLNSREDPQGRNEPSGEMASFIKSDFRDEEIHVKILDLVLEAVEKVSNITDIADKVNVFWKRFIGHIFDIEFEVLSSVDLVDKEEQMDVPNQLEALKAKPLRVMIETWDIQEKLSPIRRHQRPSNLFFGNYQFLIFFRLYELLYSRLSSCKAMCLEQSPKDIETLWTTINDFLNCRIDASKYEDELRSKVGAGSYVLFTIDRLLSLLMKQLLNLVTLPVNQKLLSLYFYEFARVKDYGTPLTLENSALFARMYLSNAVAILSDQLACVQVEFYKDTRELTMDLFEGLSAPEPKNVDPEWSGYLESYLGELEDENRSNASNPFLKRSLLQTKADPKSHGDFWLVNGLEGKICMKTYRVRYVEETEDVFVKRKSRTYNRKSFEEGALKFRKRMKL